MKIPARNTIAVIGAGPIGLETAANAIESGFDVHVFERGEVGAHALAWGHVRMFTPWARNIGPASARLLAKNGWTAPDPAALPTGAELVERLLRPLASVPELAGRIHERSQVTHVSRLGSLKGELIGAPERRDRPFRLLVRDGGGREHFLHAFAVIDASGTYGMPNWAGTGGIPARGELHLAPQMSYHCDDVLGLRRERYAGKRTLVIGGGATAATTVTALAQLAAAHPGTRVAWVTRSGDGPLAGEVPNDSLGARATLFEEARALRRGSDPAVTWIGEAEVEDIEYNSATHRYRVTMQRPEGARIEEADQVIVNTGFGPDNTIYRELQIHECYGSRGPMKLSAALLGAGTTDCAAIPAFGVDALTNPEPDFYILGSKSYARYNSFLLATGYQQVTDVMERHGKSLAELSAR